MIMNLDLARTPLRPAIVAQVSNLLRGLDLVGNPKGIASFSPGLRGTSYPGFTHRKHHQPCKGWITAATGPCSPRCRGIDHREGDR